MRTLAIILTILFGFAIAIYATNGLLVDIVNHTVCQKDKTIMSCHYYDTRL